MRLIFAGTPEFARVALAALHAAGHEVVLVLTQPDRPAGRGMKLQASAVKQFATTHGMPVLQPRSLRLDGKFADDARAAQQAIATAQADAAVVAAYGLILPQWVLDAPRLGCFNIHASLLPRWRGAAPIHRAIEAGDAETGITIMQMDAGLDTGDMLLRQALPITTEATTATLHDALAELGGRLVVRTLAEAAERNLQPVPQPSTGVTYAAKIDKTEALLDWNQPAATLARRIRAFNPAPGAQTMLNGELLKIWAATALPECSVFNSEQSNIHMPKGQIFSQNGLDIDVHTGAGVLRLTELQRAGGKRLPVGEFLRGCGDLTGTVLGAPGATAAPRA